MANLNSVSWVDDVTKIKLEGKAEKMTEMVGYPDWLLDVNELDKYYEKVKYLLEHVIVLISCGYHNLPFPFVAASFRRC